MHTFIVLLQSCINSPVLHHSVVQRSLIILDIYYLDVSKINMLVNLSTHIKSLSLLNGKLQVL